MHRHTQICFITSSGEIERDKRSKRQLIKQRWPAGKQAGPSQTWVLPLELDCFRRN